MGVISLEKSNRLIWLGRYAERTFTICRTFFRYYDEMIDKDEFAYRRFLDSLGLPYIYGGRDAFIQTYLFDEQDPNSLVNQLNRALDNAIVMREDLTSDTLCYIQMAYDVLAMGAERGAPMLLLQQVVDDLFAFWGSADDNIASEESRNLLKCGKYVERLDLYIRLDYSFPEVEKEAAKLLARLTKVPSLNSEAARAQIRACTADADTYARRKAELQGLLWNVLQ